MADLNSLINLINVKFPDFLLLKLTTLALIAGGIFGVILLAIDIFKIFIETAGAKPDRKFISDPKKFTVIITVYNEAERIARTIRLFAKIFPPERIIVADDGSTDATVEVARQVISGVRVIIFPHKGKNKTTEAALEYVITENVVLADADVYPSEDFRCPESILQESTSCAVRILPKLDYNDDRLSIGDILLGLQHHEYAKAMNSKWFGSRWKSVYSISGALGFFKTERLKYLIPQQTEVFAGEDLERTLIDLNNNGETDYINDLVETDVPRDFSHLIKQRVLSWWPGLWRCFPLLWSLLWKKKSSFALRFEVFYQILSTLNEPLKLVSLYLICLYLNWPAILGLYLLYGLLEYYAAYRLGERNKLKHFSLIIALYPLFALSQVVLRILGLTVFITRRVMSHWPAVQLGVNSPASSVIKTPVNLVFFFLLSVGNINASEYSIAPGMVYVQDSINRTYISKTVWAHYKKVWLDAQRSLYDDRIDLGVYHKWAGIDWNPQLRVRDQDVLEVRPKIVAEWKIVGPTVGRLGAAYQWFGDLQGETLQDVGLDIYYGDANYFSFDVVKQIGNNKKSNVFFLKNRFTKGSWTMGAGGSINTFGDPGLLGWFHWKGLRAGVNWDKNFEHYEFNRTSYSLSINWPLN